MLKIGADSAVSILEWGFMNDYELQRRLERVERELSEAQSDLLIRRIRVLELQATLRKLRAREDERLERVAQEARIEALEQQVQIERGLRQSAERQLAEMKTLRAKDAVSGFDRKFLQDVRRLTHPDRHNGSRVSHRVTSEINRRLNG